MTYADDLLQQADGFRRPERFATLLRICECDAAASGKRDQPQDTQHLLRALAAAQASGFPV